MDDRDALEFLKLWHCPQHFGNKGCIVVVHHKITSEIWKPEFLDAYFEIFGVGQILIDSFRLEISWPVLIQVQNMSSVQIRRENVSKSVADFD